MRPDILAIDFGTSNSAAAILENGVPRRLPIQPGSDTLPTAVFFPTEGGAMRIGDAAGAALIAREPGRYMRALKSVLGGPLLHEPRMIGGRRQTLADVIAAFLRALRERAEAATGVRYRRALSGRPVHFHTADPARDARAEADLRDCYLAAGFEEVEFLAEPEAAALACRALGTGGAAGLVVDIGGGTSDFTAFVVEDGEVRVLASHGIRLGGTDFDQAVSMAHAMPLLGLGGELRREMGPGLLPVPKAIYADLATWAKIPFLYAPATRREAALMARLATDPARMERLVRVLEEELGHELAFAVERGKIAANEDAARGAHRDGVHRARPVGAALARLAPAWDARVRRGSAAGGGGNAGAGRVEGGRNRERDPGRGIESDAAGDGHGARPVSRGDAAALAGLHRRGRRSGARDGEGSVGPARDGVKPGNARS